MSSSVNPALAALTAAFAAGLPDWQVTDGPPVQTEQNFLAVGYDIEEAGVELSRSHADYGMRSDREVYDVRCLLSAWSGDVDFPGTRTAALAALDAVTGVLIADQTVGGAVARAQLSESGLTQEIDNGSVVNVRFTVHIDAFRPGGS